MENFFVCINAVLPMFLQMMVGALARHFGVLNEQDVFKINKIAFVVFMPFLMFSNIYGSDLSSAFRPKYILFSAVCVLIVFAVTTLFALRYIKERNQKGVFIQGIYRSNCAAIGLAIASYMYKGSDISSVAVMIAVIVPLFNVIAVICLSIFSEDTPEIKTIIKKILTNPLFLGSTAGILFLITGWQLPAALDAFQKSFGSVGAPLVLFALGAFFKLDSLHTYARQLAVVVIARLILVPAFVIGLACLIGFRNVEMCGIVAVFGSSTAINSFTMAQQMGGDAELAGDIVVVTSILCSFTLFGWCFLLKSLGIM